MGGFIGGLITVVVIIAGLVQALAPVFKSISEAIEKSKRPPVQNPGPEGGMNANRPNLFLPDMTQQGVQRPVATTSRPANVSQPKHGKGLARRQQQRPGKQQGSITAGPSVKPVAIDRSPGSGVGAHVDTFIGQHVKSHIGHQIDTSVKNDISDQVRSHLGEGNKPDTTSATATSHGSGAAADLLSALRSPAGVKQAILMSEILSKPQALRRS